MICSPVSSIFFMLILSVSNIMTLQCQSGSYLIDVISLTVIPFTLGISANFIVLSLFSEIVLFFNMVGGEDIFFLVTCSLLSVSFEP